MALTFRDLVGMHCMEAFWEGTVDGLVHPVCSDVCLDPTGICTIRNPIPMRREYYAVLVKLDDQIVLFREQPISTGKPGDRSTFATVAATDPQVIGSWQWPWDFQFDAAAGGPLVLEFRLQEDDTAERLYATSDAAEGRCLFYVGTEFDTDATAHGFETDRADFVYEFDLKGVRAPWLEPVDDGPKPVEIPGRKPPTFKNYRKGITHRHEFEERRSRTTSRDWIRNEREKRLKQRQRVVR